MANPQNEQDNCDYNDVKDTITSQITKKNNYMNPYFNVMYKILSKHCFDAILPPNE